MKEFVIFFSFGYILEVEEAVINIVCAEYIK